MVCAAKGIIQVASSRAFSQEKLDQMVALGAQLALVPHDGGGITKRLVLDMIERARTLSREPLTRWTDQLNDEGSIAGPGPHLIDDEALPEQTSAPQLKRCWLPSA